MRNPIEQTMTTIEILATLDVMCDHLKARELTCEIDDDFQGEAMWDETLCEMQNLRKTMAERFATQHKAQFI